MSKFLQTVILICVIAAASFGVRLCADYANGEVSGMVLLFFGWFDIMTIFLGCKMLVENHLERLAEKKRGQIQEADKINQWRANPPSWRPKE